MDFIKYRRASEPGRRVDGRIGWGYATYLGWLVDVSGVVRDVSEGVVQRIGSGCATYPAGFRTGSSGFGTGSTRRWTYRLGLCNVSGVVGGRIRCGSGRIRRGCTTYREWLHNVSGGVQNRVVGVRNRVDASLDVSVGVVQCVGSWKYKLTIIFLVLSGVGFARCSLLVL